MERNQFTERLAEVRKRNIVKHRKYQVWPIEKKVEVVTQWLVLGNMRLVAAVTGVGYDLVRQWKGEPWWKELETEIRETQNIELDHKLSEIVNRSMSVTLDRLENGDWFYDQKTGELRRKPVPMREVAKVANDFIGKRELIRTNVSEKKIEATQASVINQLDMLKVEFAKWSKSKTIDMPMVEIVEDVEDAIHEEREEGLQEGGSSVYLEAGSNQEEDSAERSEASSGSSGPSEQG